ncbi:hypothetical protein ACE10Z_37210 [Bradyrhizobium sp. Pha-3]|uniref:hypothetical protein n=1 Tax=Bradyrhizobium sp. Pha-3 TaxID=208375 RepID=UPI0035D4A998
MARIEAAGKCLSRGTVPARMNHAQSRKIQPDRQTLEPGECLLMSSRTLPNLPEKFLMLMGVLFGVRPKKWAAFRAIGLWRLVCRTRADAE